ncbi:MAG: sigma-54-dependent transcriptional regulator [Desulfobaccales bacterium]
MYRYKILIVDDDKLLQNSLKNVLSEKYDTLVVGRGEDAPDLLRKHSVDLVLLDVRLPGQDGIETLQQIKALERELMVIMMTAYEDVKTVITSMKMGAYDYLVKPLEIEELEIIVEKALDNLKLKKEVEELRKNYLKEFNVGNIIGESPAIKRAIEFANKVAKSYDTTVLIEGETGVGKEVIARTIQSRSDRFNKPFVIINCGAISKDLVESEMFGYERGTFTGGLQEGKKGKLEMADGGTLLLDEISELLPASQVKLLRFLEEKEFFPVGGTQKRKVDIRIIAATNKSLEEECRAGRFREDLYYRLNVAKITIPPLKERQVDILPLSLFFMNSFNEKFGKNFRAIAPLARQLLLDYPWRGNVRELRNAIERVILMEEGEEIQPAHLTFLGLTPPENGPQAAAAADMKLPATGLNLEALVKGLIIQALELSNGNRTRAARFLGISRPTLIYRLEKYGIEL